MDYITGQVLPDAMCDFYHYECDKFNILIFNFIAKLKYINKLWESSISHNIHNIQFWCEISFY